MYQVLDVTQVAQQLAKAIKKPILCLTFPSPVYDKIDASEIFKAAPYLSINNAQAIIDGYAFIVCKNEKEMNHLYDQTVGDDGPTKLNPYKGKARIHALTISAGGELLNENT